MEQVIGESVKETNRVFIKDYTQHYCKAITENYKLYHIDSMQRMLAREGHESIYATNQLNDIQTGKANLMKFEIREGKKYYKIVQVEFDTSSKTGDIGQFIHLSIKIQAMFTNLHHGKHLIQNM